MPFKIYHHYLFVLLMTVLLTTHCLAGTTVAPDKGFNVVNSTFPANRLALVIGNANYEKNYQLENPINDATDIATLLRQVGFKVIQINDANQATMKNAIREFGQQLEAKTTGLFYFSGHGAQHNGSNYLLPLGAINAISAPGHLDQEAVTVDYVLAVMEEAHNNTNIIILDACRDNPFKNLFRGGGSRGFAPMIAPSGTLIAYATKAGEKALDGKGQRNSPYVIALKQELLKPGIEIERMLKNIRLIVMEATHQQQAPAYYNELNTDFCFVEPCGHQSQPIETQIESQLPKTFTNSIGIKFIRIPAGQFTMGDGVTRSKQEINHYVITIANPFYMSQYEVTQEQWTTLMEMNPSHFKGLQHPIENVSWEQVQEFIKRLNQLEKTDKYRLPTEAEWEYAVRAGTQTTYYFGNDATQLGDYAWYLDNSDGKTHPVGRKKPNAFGLYDVYGNVWEWTCSHYTDPFARTMAMSCDMTHNGLRVVRGGSWGLNSEWMRSANRGWNNLTDRNGGMGLRIVTTR